MADQKGWVTTQTKNGKVTLGVPFYATNPRYIEVHNEWDWKEVPLNEAVQGVARHGLRTEPDNGSL